jgi:hypothetical protein
MSYSSLMAALPLMLLLLAAQYDGSDAFAFVVKVPSIKSRSSLAVAMIATAPPPPLQVVSPSSSASTSTTAYSSSPSNLPSQKELAGQSKSTTAASSVISKDTATPSTPPPLPPKSTNVASGTGITISDIHYNGDVPKTEADEYVVISNNLKTPVDISGYYLYVATTGTQGPTFYFPKGTTLAPGNSNNKAMVRIYTNEIHKETGGYSFNSGKAIWSNNGGLAVLKDANGKKIMEYKYNKATN